MHKHGRIRTTYGAVLLGAAAIALPAQTFNTLVNFNGANGANPQFMSLVQGNTRSAWSAISSCLEHHYGTSQERRVQGHETHPEMLQFLQGRQQVRD
jgi:hypothetical protein